MQIFSENSSKRIVLFFFFSFQVSIPANYSLCGFHSIKFRSGTVRIRSHSTKDQPISYLNFLRNSYSVYNNIMSITCHAKNRAVLLFKISHWDVISFLVNSCVELIFYLFQMSFRPSKWNWSYGKDFHLHDNKSFHICYVFLWLSSLNNNSTS